MTLRSEISTDSSLQRFSRFLPQRWREKGRTIFEHVDRIFPGLDIPIQLPSGVWWTLRRSNLGASLAAGQFETAELAFVQRFLRPGMIVLDIGAHHGAYTILASKSVGRSGKVIAFEPSRRERRALRLHVFLNRCTNVLIQDCALGSENAEVELYVANPQNSGCNSFRPPASDVRGETQMQTVQMVKLDQWLVKNGVFRVDFIKLDVEGGELETLRGAGRLLDKRPRPLVLIEVQDVRTVPWGYKAKELIHHLRAKGYEWFDLSADGSLKELDVNRDEYEGNFIACPEERTGLVS
jgi:FkbM family methyltransferase